MKMFSFVKMFGGFCTKVQLPDPTLTPKRLDVRLVWASEPISSPEVSPAVDAPPGTSAPGDP